MSNNNGLFSNIIGILTVLVNIASVLAIYKQSKNFLVHQEKMFNEKERIKLQESKITNLYVPFLQDYLEYKSYKISTNRVNCMELFPYLKIYKTTLETLKNNIHLVPSNVQVLIPQFNAYLTISSASYELENSNDLSEISRDSYLSQHLDSIMNLYDKISLLMLKEYKSICEDLKIDCNISD